MNDLNEKYKVDEKVWDRCASTYEDRIVGGHPDISAFEQFEEDFVDRVLVYMAKTQNRPLKLMDIGCGSGRLHVRYGCKSVGRRDAATNPHLLAMKEQNNVLAYDPALTGGLREIWGIDFSARMIELAQHKIGTLGLDQLAPTSLAFEKGSAFQLPPQSQDVLPVAVCLVNSIGVMQGPGGARALFRSMKEAVEPAGGIAIISCYQREYLPHYGLGQYESTLDVSGQPAWMAPDTYAKDEFVQVSRQYKRAYDPDNTLFVDVYDPEGVLVKEGHVLKRDSGRTAHTIASGEIRTYGDYESHWYSFDQIEAWKNELWSKNALHIHTRVLDGLRAEPAQMVVLDSNGSLDRLFKRWELR
jgi:SAM-dependent methyltransferase